MDAPRTVAGQAARPRHVYVHVPFCARRCSYCDFSIAVRKQVPVREYVEGVSREVALRFPAADPGDWRADTLYLGGGTPSRLGASGVMALLDALRAVLSLEHGAEVTLEANPEDVSASAARAWRAAGVTRVSLGAQSFSDPVLAWMHRVHDAAAIARAVHDVREAGIDALSLDLIFALPPEVPRDWRRDLELALALAPDHLSLYGLTVEPATPLARWRARGDATDAPEERYAAEFLLAHELATAAGLEHYEVSNFGRAGAHARHNAAYWTDAPYAGLGPSAHEFDGARRRWNVAPYAEWLARVQGGADPRADEEELTAEQRIEEAVFLALRTRGGLSLDDREWVLAQPWLDAGWGEQHGSRLALTPEGWLRMDAIALDVVRSRLRV